MISMCKSPQTIPLRDRLVGTDRLFRDTGYDGDDFAVLQITRYLFQNLSHPKSQSWAKAIEIAGKRTDCWDGPAVLTHTFHTMRSMQRARKSTFRFSNPNCTHCSQILTAQERQFLGVIVEMRRNRLDRAKAHATLLCEGNDVSAFLAESAQLAVCLPRIEALEPKETGQLT